MSRLGPLISRYRDINEEFSAFKPVRKFEIFASATINGVKQKVYGVLETRENIIALQKEYVEKLKQIISENKIKADNLIMDEVAELQNKIFYLLVDGNPEKIVEITLSDIKEVIKELD